MKLRKLCIVALLALSLQAMAVSIYDLTKPFGFCMLSSRTSSSSTYDITGGGTYEYPVTGDDIKVVTLVSSGSDMKAAITNAITNNDVVVLDGSQGDFIVSSVIELRNVSAKTVLGINNARLCTSWYVTDDIVNALNNAGVPSMSTSGGGGTLSNGTYVKEQAEYNTRQIIIDMTGDQSEAYRKSGIFFMRDCRNIIVRNLRFVGPGSIDVGGSDLLSFYGTKNCWVDHCDFTDGMDGNFDITQKSDFNTVSWCTFSYTERSYMHQNTNLIGSSDSETKGYLNTTFAFNHWGEGCRARMPMARVGKIHMLNNYFSSTTASTCINPRINSEFLIEGNYFAEGVKKYYSQNGASAVTWTDANYIAELGSGSAPSSFGATVTVPYDYSVADYNVVPTEVTSYAGATLYKNSGGGETGIQGVVEAGRLGTDDAAEYNLSGQRVDSNSRGIVIVNHRIVVK